MVWERLPLLCVAIIFLLHLRPASAQSTNRVENVKRPGGVNTSLQQPNTLFAWSAWGAWSVCSRSCGGGVSVQERQCLPRDPSRSYRRRRRKLTSPERLNRSPRHVGLPADGNSLCPGIAKRYHECNTQPCPGPPGYIQEPEAASRAEQCAAYDRRPFRGRFYTWVPYVDGNAPCVLNCRPRGQQFYANLGRAADGTSCTRPGTRAFCVQGVCQAVGNEAVLSSADRREVRCGRRLVSGLFSRPRLPLGYSHVATVPRGACRLNISEIIPSDNYIALKMTNGSFIINGDFAVSSPGPYEAAGTRFQYTRVAGLDHVFAHGPVQHPIDIMILYTQANPSIKYEYLTDSEDTSNDILNPSSTPHQTPPRHHRHHVAEPHKKSLEPSLAKTDYNAYESQSQIENNVVGPRKFIWKIISFTQCSRTCGGGLQIGKFKCVEADGKEDKEVSPAHCSGAPPSARRRRCGGAACPPRWRAAPWGPCPVCGPAHKTRIVGCVQDHARGIIKISDMKCPLPMPPSSEPCDIPNCDGTAATTESSRPDARRQIRTRDRTEHFRDAPVITLTSNTTDIEGRRVNNQNYSFSTAGGWMHTEWSECVGWCIGGGLQSRGVRCSDPAGCAPRHAPQASQSCTPRNACDSHEGQWFTSEWSPCSASCGGRAVRGVLCIGGSGRRLKEAACRRPKPEAERACGQACSPQWYLADWGECTGPCEAGVQSRAVWCARGGAEAAGGAAPERECGGARPPARRSCVPARCTSAPAPSPPSTVLTPQPAESQQRVTRHQARSDIDIKERSFTDGKPCADRLRNCALAVQARLCHYPYYAEYCCNSCRGK